MPPDNMNIEQLLQQWKERAQKAEQEAERAQKAVQKAEKRLQKVKKWAERRVQEAEEKIRGLLWPEALFLWHTIHANPTIEPRHNTIAAGQFTKPTGRRYPTLLCRWPKFHDLHKKAFEDISYHFAKPESSAFYSREHYESNAKDFMRGCKLDSEAALVAYEERTVEDLVVNTWWLMGEGQIRFKSREGHSLDHTKDRVNQTNTGAGTTAKLKNRQYDKVCYVITDQGESIDLFVVEYKAADKLTARLVKAGLHKMKVETIKDRIQVSTKAGARTKQKAEEAIVVVLTQTFDYMVSQGLSYGYVNGGDVFIFLYIDPNHIQNLYYESVILEKATTPSDQMLRLTAVGLVAGFTKMAYDNVESRNLWTEDLRIKAQNELSIWGINDSKILEKLPETPKRAIGDSDESPPFNEAGPERPPDGSPAETRARAREREGRTDSQNDERGARYQSRKGDKSRKRKRSGTYSDNNIQRPVRPYCTQVCLLGLIRGHDLDKKCPNVQAHRKEAREDSCNQHTLDQPTLVRLIDEQLQKTPERNYNGGFKSLGRSGWAGALFRLELLSHGYTFVGKGTVQPLVKVLHIEANMYKRMDALQGKAIPVYLGNVDFKSPFWLTTSVAIVHLMLLSWAGEEAWKCGIESKRLQLETSRTYNEVAALGVEQRDLRPPNILWNFELDRAILIDFEYACINEADGVIETAIAEQAKAKKKIKRLGRIRGNSQDQTGNHPSVE